MSKDTIYREDAIKEIEEYIVKENEAISEHPDDIFKYNSGLLTAIQAVHDLPSADRPQGYWTKTDVATYRCSECGKIQIADDINELNYCCCCGSRNKMRMKGADDE